MEARHFPPRDFQLTNSQLGIPLLRRYLTAAADLEAAAFFSSQTQRSHPIGCALLPADRIMDPSIIREYAVDYVRDKYGKMLIWSILWLLGVASHARKNSALDIPELLLLRRNVTPKRPANSFAARADFTTM